MAKYLLYFFIILITGCATMEAEQRLSYLDMTTAKYGDAVRWGHYETANSFKSPGAAKQSIDGNPGTSYTGSIRVTSYDPVDRKLLSDNFEARQIVEIKYYFINQMIERTLLDTQIWRYDLEDDRWYLHSNLPNFTQDSIK